MTTVLTSLYYSPHLSLSVTVKHQNDSHKYFSLSHKA